MEIKWLPLPDHGDETCMLVTAEGGTDIPFSIRRVYYFCHTDPSAHRGFHAHKQLQQVFVCLHGGCTVLLDDGFEQQTVELSDPCQGLYVGPGIWREMYDFQPDTVLLALTDRCYEEEDYIRDYEAFLRWVRT